MARRRRRKSISRRLFEEATRTLPAPVQYAVATPFRLFVTLGLLGAAVSYGLVSIDWSGGHPSLKINQEKAAELRERGMEFVEQESEQLRDRLWGDEHEAIAEKQPASGFGGFFQKTKETDGSVDTAARPRPARVGIRRD